jgi:nitroimidazol reductase NimA-like FMN-containing flavoprotein (pyridoxamine 5'-phosphate oxidase superfamily)
MITKDKGLLRNDVLKFLQKNKVAVVATASKDGIPEAATITYLFDDDFNFYFITRKQSQKLINLRKNPNVALVIGTDAKIPATVQIQGHVTIIKKPDEYVISYLTKKIKLSKTEWQPLLKVKGMDYVFIKVKTESLRWLDLDAKKYPKNYSENFQQIIP